MFWIRTAALFLLRSGRSTATLSLMVVAAVATLIFLSSLAIGVNDTMIRNSVGLFTGHISGDALPASIYPDDLKIKGTRGTLKRSVTLGTLRHQNRHQRVSLISVDPAAEKKYTTLWMKAVEGRYLQSQKEDIFLSQAIADQLGVKSGAVLNFRSEQGDFDIQLTISGLYQTGIAAFDMRLAFCSFDTVSTPSPTWNAAVFLKNDADPNAIIAQYRQMLPDTLVFKSWQEMMPDLVQLIDLNYLSMNIVMVLVFGVVSIGIACAFVIFVLKYLREYGIMKAMGVTPGEMSLLIFSEVLLMNIAAGAIGTLVGILAVSLIGQGGVDLSNFTSYNPYFSVSGIIFPRLTTYSVVGPPLLAVCFSMASALWPVLIVYRKRAAEILRLN